MTELQDLRKEDILNSDLIGDGIPDLGEEIAKLQAGESDFDEVEEPVDVDVEEDVEDEDCEDGSCRRQDEGGFGF